MYFLVGETITRNAGIISRTDMVKTWHLRLGHVSEKGMSELVKQGLIDKTHIGKLDFCETCVLGKSARLRFPSATYKTESILKYVHSDLWGPARVSSHGGNRYYMSIIDDYSGRAWVYLIKHKNEAYETFRNWKSLVENQTGKKIKKLRTDNGLEYCSEVFNEMSK